MENMIYGNATVEIAVRPHDTEGVYVEPAYFGLEWRRFNVYHFVRSHGGYEYDVVGHPGTGWAHEDNVRNFVRLPDVEYEEEETRSNLLAGRSDR